MKIISIVLPLLQSLTFLSCNSQSKILNSSNIIQKNLVLRQDFKTYFDNCHVPGSIAIFDINLQQWILSDTVDTRQETLPASTFKIVNMLIALETNIIKDENEIVKWGGKTDTIKYGYRPEIYHDMSVKEAFQVSAGWVFIELAKKIGRENYKKYLSLCHYGNLDLSHEDVDFWNFGSLAISPVNQVEFIKKLYEGKLPFSKRNVEIVKKIMPTDIGHLYTIKSKTGWTRENNINIGWWVGYLNNDKGAYIFATRLVQDRRTTSSEFGSCRKEITKAVFKALNAL